MFPIHECLKFDWLKYKNDINSICVCYNKIFINENGNERNLRILLKSLNNKQYKKDSRIWTNLGSEYRVKGDYKKSISAYKKAIKYNTCNNNQLSRLYYNLALEYKIIRK